MLQDERFMAEAIALAAANAREGRGGPFGALVVRAGQVVGRGVNRVVSSHDPTAHAEMVAIREACQTLGSFQLAGCEIFASCEPCPMCLAAIYWARLDRLCFAATQDDAARAGFDDSFLYAEIARPPAARRLASVRLLADQAPGPFEEWARAPSKVPY